MFGKSDLEDKIIKCLQVGAIVALYAFVLLFANVSFGSAQNSEDPQDCEAQSVPTALGILRLGLAPSLKDSAGGIPNT